MHLNIWIHSFGCPETKQRSQKAKPAVDRERERERQEENRVIVTGKRDEMRESERGVGLGQEQVGWWWMIRSVPFSKRSRAAPGLSLPHQSLNPRPLPPAPALQPLIKGTMGTSAAIVRPPNSSAAFSEGPVSALCSPLPAPHCSAVSQHALNQRRASGLKRPCFTQVNKSLNGLNLITPYRIHSINVRKHVTHT